MDNIITRKKYRSGLLACFTAACMFLALSGCGKPSGKSVVVATVGNMKMTVSDFYERISHLPERYQEIVKRRKGEYLQEWINDTLLYQEALRKNVHKGKDVQKVIEEARKKILIARLLKDEVDDAIDITEDDIREFYRKNRARYITPEIMRVSHILVPSREESENILEELAGGARFEDLARARSVDPTAQRGGDIGYFPKGQLMPEFEAGCARLDVGGISGVVKTKLGYHVIMLTDRRQPKPRPIKDVDEDIRSRLRTVKRQKIFNELLRRLREETDVEVNEEALQTPSE